MQGRTVSAHGSEDGRERADLGPPNDGACDDDGGSSSEDELDERHDGLVATATEFASAIRSTDDPPLLVLLNSCNSASQIDALVEHVVPFAIGMADEIDDVDAINYAAQFYAAIANGQSINWAHRAGKSRLELDGLNGAKLPTLAWAPDVDPAGTNLVKPTDAVQQSDAASQRR